MKKKDKDRLKMIVAASFIFIIAMQGGYLAQFGIKPFVLGTELIPGITGQPVDVTQYLYHVLDEGVAANTNIRVYKDNGGSPGAFSESVTSATGVITYRERYLEGETLWLQARIAAPGTSAAATYMTPLTKFVVPAGDANDDAVLPSWGIYETATTAVSFVATNQAGHAVTGTGETACLNTTDSALKVTISVGVDDTCYGTPEAFTDTVTSFAYAAGLFIVLNFNCTQDLVGATYSFSEGDAYYYVYSYPMLIDDVSDPASGTATFTINAVSFFDNAGGAGINATLGIDIYDGCKFVGSGGVDSNSFIDYDSDLGPTTAIATYVHQ